MADRLNPFSVLLEVATTGRRPVLPVRPVEFRAAAKPEPDDFYWDDLLDEGGDD
jgi:hypothetical protein